MLVVATDGDDGGGDGVVGRTPRPTGEGVPGVGGDDLLGQTRSGSYVREIRLDSFLTDCLSTWWSLYLRTYSVQH